LIETSSEISGEIEKDLIRELSELTEKIRMAIAMHVDAVTRTQLVRRKLINRLFRLAGTAPEPVTYEFEGDVL
jgi:predicted NodU family carbamoyl transferase